MQTNTAAFIIHSIVKGHVPRATYGSVQLTQGMIILRFAFCISSSCKMVVSFDFRTYLNATEQ